MTARRLKGLLAGTALGTLAPFLIPPAQADHADVDVTADSPGIDLDGTAYDGLDSLHVADGVTVEAEWPFSTYGVSATTRAWTVTNDGNVVGTTHGLILDQGGQLLNNAGAYIESDAFGNALRIDNGAATVDNHGHIVGGTGAVSMRGGGSLTNHAGGVIRAATNQSAVLVRGGTERRVENYGLIESTVTTGFSTGIEITRGGGTGASSIFNGAGGIIRGGANAIYAHSDAQGISIANGGLIESTGNFPAGDPGQRGPAIVLFSAPGSVVQNFGTIRSGGGAPAIWMNASGLVVNSGTISGGGTQAIVFEGDHDNHLQLVTGSVIDGTVLAGGGTDRLTLTGSGTETLTKFVDFEHLVVLTAGQWTLEGTGAMSVDGLVREGTLVLDGTLSTPLLTVRGGAGVIWKGILKGNGTVLGNLAVDGILAPGNSIGTLSASSATFGAYSTYEVELDDGGNVAGANNDLLDVGGAVTIHGGAIHVKPANGTDDGSTYAPGLTYTVIRAAGGVTGAFDSLVDDFAFLDFTHHYDVANEVYLTSALATPGFCLAGMTANQCAAGGGVSSLGGGSLYTAVVNLSNDEAPGALDALSGEIHASALGTLLEDSRFPREAALERLRSAGEDASEVSPESRAAGGPVFRGAVFWGPVFWGQAFAAGGERDGDGNAAPASRDIAGLFAGADAAVSDALRLGAFGGYSRSRLRAAERASAATVDSYHVGAYGAAGLGDFSLRFGAAHAWHDIDTARSVDFTGFADSLSAGYGARTSQVFGEVGYAFLTGGIRFEPFVNAAYVHAASDGYSEAGGGAALAGGARNASAAYATLGLRAQVGMDLGGAKAKLTAGLGWRHAGGDLTPFAVHALAGGDGFAVAGAPLAKNALVLDLGAAVTLSPGASLGLSYGGRFGSGLADHTARASLKVAF